MQDKPFAASIDSTSFVPSRYDKHIVRTLSSMHGQFFDTDAYEHALHEEDRELYEVYFLERPNEIGEMACGTSILHPGKIGDEFCMTKGHFHSVMETAEVYYGLDGEGMLLMETPEGEWAAEELRPGKIVYVPPRWAHRSVNTGDKDLVVFFVFPAHTGQNYGSIEEQGFRKLVLDRGGKARIEDNPRWLPPEKRKRVEK